MRSPWLLLPVALVVLFPSTSASAPADPAARGLDAFIHAGNTAPAGSPFVLDLEAFGFGTVIEATPLAGATIDLAWDPEHLGKGVSSAPPTLSVTSDATGHAHVSIPVPVEGTDDDLVLLVHMRHGSHVRDRELSVKRTWTESLELHVADQRVVPGDDVTAWATVTNTATGQPIPNAAVRVSLLEDSYARTVVHTSTDAAGAVMVNVPVPPIDDPQIDWVLSAELDRAERGAHFDIPLTLRDETPGTPWLDSRFDATDVDTGGKAAFTLRLRDGSWEPMASQALRYWAGPTGTTAPATDAAWLAGSTLASTDGSGEVHGSIDAPKLVRGGSSSLTIVAKATIEGTPLEATGQVHVGAPVETVKLIAEAVSLVPGLEQRLLLRVLDPHDRGISGEFEVTGDGLAVTVKTDANGEAELSWKAPVGVGASRNVGPCAGGVAAAVSVRGKGVIAGLEKRTDPFSLCVRVDREASSIVRLDRTVAHVGEKVHISVVSDKPGKEPISVVFTQGQGKATYASASAWIDPSLGGDVELPEATPGVWQLTVASPRAHEKAAIASGALLVLPRSLPKLTATLAPSSRLAPSGTAEIDATITDDTGKPLTGTVASVMVDLTGGGSMDGIVALDTRTSLCRSLEISPARCDAVLAVAHDADPTRRAALAESVERPTLPVRDPSGFASQELDEAFAAMLRSLEGAVYESSASPDTLRDVRRKTASGWELNPELLTLTTAAMSEPPRTPGGETLSLGDLLTIDRQVTYDIVAKRVTRLKLVHLLAAVRQQKHDRSLDDLDPIWNDPNALLRRMVGSGELAPAALLDPWGGTLAFTKAARQGHPLLDVVPGWQLRSRGPNGVLGDGDDLTDPFARVLAAGTPYARALGEDKIVDSKWDMEVSEPSVEAWNRLLEQLTGMSLGGTGEGGGGGFGSGHGRLGGHTAKAPTFRSGEAFSDRRPALWTAPVRTDAQGHVHLSIKLDAIETTWGVGLVALADHAPPSTAIVKLPVALPISARVDVSSRWVEGDEVAVRLTLRNRTQTATHAKLALTAGGVATLSDPKEASRDVELPAAGATVVSVNVKANQAGLARLSATITANGVVKDTLTESWDVRSASERQTRVQSTWVTGEDTLEVTPLAGESLAGVPQLTIERGFGSALFDALSSLDPDAVRGAGALSASLEVSARVKRWAEPQADRAALVARARDFQGRAAARLRRATSSPPTVAMLTLYAPATTEREAPADACPRADVSRDDVGMLEAEPPLHAGSSLPCWDTFVTDVLGAAKTSNDPARLAAAVLAFGERPHRASLLSGAASSLRDLVSLRADGSINLASKQRRDRVLVYAALVRAAELGVVLPASEERLLGWLSIDRDAHGGYGSPRATRAVVRALLGSRLGVAQASRAKVTIGDRTIDVAVPAQGRVVVPLLASTTHVVVSTQGAPFLARFERPLARSFLHPPDVSASPLHLDVPWPTSIVANQVVTLHVTARSADPASAIIRIPLPAGATLATWGSDVRQIQGMLIISANLGTSDSAWDIPLRFRLRGHMTAAESRATTDDDEPTIAPSAQPIVR